MTFPSHCSKACQAPALSSSQAEQVVLLQPPLPIPAQVWCSSPTHPDPIPPGDKAALRTGGDLHFTQEQMD